MPVTREYVSTIRIHERRGRAKPIMVERRDGSVAIVDTVQLAEALSRAASLQEARTWQWYVRQRQCACGRGVGKDAVLMAKRYERPPLCRPCACRERKQAMTPEERSNAARKGKKAMSKEQLSAVGRKRAAAMTMEQRRAAALKREAKKREAKNPR